MKLDEDYHASDYITVPEDHDLNIVRFVSSSVVLNLDTELLYRPIENNEYYAEIYNSEEKIELTKSIARKLSRNCKITPIN